MKKQFYIAPISEIINISNEGSVCITASEALELGFWGELMDGGDL